MSFEGEFAHYEPLRRIFSSEKVEKFINNLHVKDIAAQTNDVIKQVIKKEDLDNNSNTQPDLILAIDGSVAEADVHKGFPNANYGYITVASVLIDLKKIKTLETEKFPDPREVMNTESASTIEAVFPGCNVIQSEDETPKEYLRRKIYEELQNVAFIDGGETLLETYEYLLDIKLKNPGNLPKCPIEGYEDKNLLIQHGIYECPYSGKTLYSTDALRLHELMNPNGSNGELFGQIMSTFEKLCFINILRAFEKKENWLPILRRVAFFIDGPLAVFSTPSWLAKSISEEICRINNEQKKINNQDMIIIGIEKTGTFCNHFEELDTTKEGIQGAFPKASAFLLNDEYIKKNIIFSDSSKPYGADTYYGRKFFYKTSSGQRLVPVIASYSDYERDLSTANINQYSRLKDIMELLDQLVSSRYPNAITPLVSAHAEAAIPFNIGQKLFEQIARQIIERDKNG